MSERVDRVLQILRETDPGVAEGSALCHLLEETRVFFRRFVVVNDIQADVIALWDAHTYVYSTARATPYLHFWSPEWGSGKTTALELLEVIAREGRTADDLTGPSLFRLVDAMKPTLLFDEVDGVFDAKKNSDTTADLKKILNSGYKAGKRVVRMGGPQKTELQEFDPFCPKALAGLKDIPGTLAHRSIPIAMQPPLPTEAHEDFDPEEIEEEAAELRFRWKTWAEAEGTEAALRDPRLKPPKVQELDARRNEIWRILFRIADLAEGRWPEAARAAAKELCGGNRRTHEASTGIKLLTDIKQVFSAEKMSCVDLVDALNAIEESTCGGWNDGVGIRTRELGWKLKPYGIHAKSIRMDDGKVPNGYERVQFEEAFSRYLPTLIPEQDDDEDAESPNTGEKTATTATTQYQSQKQAQKEPLQNDVVPVVGAAANPHEQNDVAVVAVSKAEYRDGGVNGRSVYCAKHSKETTVEKVAAGIVYLKCGCHVWAEDGLAP
jgi:hypothetical protein